jgi:hypothetical protein
MVLYVYQPLKLLLQAGFCPGPRLRAFASLR